MKPARHLISLVALLCFGEVALPDAAAQQTDELRKEFQNTKAKAEKGDAAAQCNLAVMYFRGEGVPKDIVQAHVWFNIAGAKEDEDAKKNLGTVEEQMTSEQKAEAMKLARELFAKLPKG